MNNIKTYILEKLHINKNTKVIKITNELKKAKEVIDNYLCRQLHWQSDEDYSIDIDNLNDKDKITIYWHFKSIDRKVVKMLTHGLRLRLQEELNDNLFSCYEEEDIKTKKYKIYININK